MTRQSTLEGDGGRHRRWVPDRPSSLDGLDELVGLAKHLSTVVLTGAGCSTESGIPDYRGPEREGESPDPMTYREFVSSASARRRYWARAALGWPRFRAARPNRAHRALARLEAAGEIEGIITQNVDRLHQQAGSEEVVELHGALADVLCLECGRMVSRDALQEELRSANPGWADRHAELAPDGDASLPTDIPEDFDVPRCQDCGGPLKPDVVFFGENVAEEVTEAAWELFDRAELLLVVGSSLEVWSGYRFVRRAAERREPVALINLGETRGDDEAWVRVEAKAGDAMVELVRDLGGEARREQGCSRSS